MEKFKRNKGITLIVLVITVIVLLILAGVTIAALSGENRNIEQGYRGKGEKQRGYVKRNRDIVKL